MSKRVSALAVVLFLAATSVRAGDWARFRGPNGSGASADDKATPVEWDADRNMKWKVALPGPGHSSPIVVGDRVFVTCWSGYGTDQQDPGDQAELRRHLVCLDRHTGETMWDKSVEAVLPEERYGGMFAQHGYTSHTPVSDGQHVYVFYGKSGVLAFDMDGNQIWQTSVGTDLDARSWGSASSPVLYENLVIITASIESHSLFALDKNTGTVVWKKEAEGFGSTWGTPVLVNTAAGTTELVLAVPYEIWGFNPETGKLNWYCESIDSDGMRESAVAEDGIVYAMGGRQGGSIAVRAGGQGDVTETHVVWSGQDRASISSPLIHDGRLYWINGGVANCIDATTGERVYQERLTGGSSPSRGGNEPADRERGDRGFGGFGGRGFGGRGPGGGQDYSSPVVADGKLYFVKRSGDVFVIKLGPEFQQLAVNSLADGGEFSATPAISEGDIFIRSTKSLYCISGS